MNIIDATIASCSIPFIFLPKKIDNNLYVDAFIINNYACNVLCDDMENTVGINLIGILDKGCMDSNIKTFQDYILNLFISFQTNKSINYIPKLNIELKDTTSPVDFDVNENKKKEMFLKAYNATIEIIKDYLNKEEIIKTSKNNTETEKNLETNNNEVEIQENNEVENEKNNEVEIQENNEVEIQENNEAKI